MLSAFSAWLASVLSSGRATVREVWDKIKLFGNTTWSLVVLVVGWLFTAVVWLGDLITETLASIASLVIPTISTTLAGSVASYAALANTVLPLSEAMVFLVAYLGMLLILTIYRLVKSWIPTLS
jgi:hypothetical protein